MPTINQLVRKPRSAERATVKRDIRLTPAEAAHADAMCERDGMTFGELVRGLLASA